MGWFQTGVQRKDCTNMPKCMDTNVHWWLLLLIISNVMGFLDVTESKHFTPFLWNSRALHPSTNNSAMPLKKKKKISQTQLNCSTLEKALKLQGYLGKIRICWKVTLRENILCAFIFPTEYSAVHALGKFSTVQTVRAKPTNCLNPTSALQAKAVQSTGDAPVGHMECSWVALSSCLLLPIAKFHPLLPSSHFRLKAPSLSTLPSRPHASHPRFFKTVFSVSRPRFIFWEVGIVAMTLCYETSFRLKSSLC